MIALELKIYEIFKARFSEQEAASVIEYFEQKAEQKYIENIDVLTTKEDIGPLKKKLKRQNQTSLNGCLFFG